MIEYIIIDEPHADVQKKLNQWRHKYAIAIMYMHQSSSNHNHTYVALTRNEFSTCEPIPPEYRL